MSSERSDLADAAHVLARLGLVTAFGHVSTRPAKSMLITPAADLATVAERDVVETSIDVTTLPPRAPAEAWAHMAVYGARPDARAIVRAHPPGAFALTATTTSVTPLHGQAAWLGKSIPVHDDARLLRSRDLAERMVQRLGDGDAVLLRGNGAITVGETLGVAVTRMWLLSTACDVYLTARASGQVTPLTADEITSWRAVGDELIPRLWQHLRRTRGRTPPGDDQPGPSRGDS
jgi:HCOMODA/2-hydroxy-3-carboxy-muconic semialdehyde decarboxylase